jgi:hypothetical protein
VGGDEGHDRFYTQSRDDHHFEWRFTFKAQQGKARQSTDVRPVKNRGFLRAILHLIAPRSLLHHSMSPQNYKKHFIKAPTKTRKCISDPELDGRIARKVGDGENPAHLPKSAHKNQIGL